MIEITPGKFVTISLSNGQIISGNVEKWSEEMISLKASNDGGITIITNPLRDVIFIYYKEEKLEKEQLNVSKIDSEWEEIMKEPISDHKNKKLADLRILMSKVEKDIVAKKLKSHTVGEVRTVKYGIPKFFKKPGTE